MREVKLLPSEMQIPSFCFLSSYLAVPTTTNLRSTELSLKWFYIHISLIDDIKSADELSVECVLFTPG